MNNQSAHFGLSLTLLGAFLAGCATGDFSRARPAAPPAVYARAEVTYENRWVNGINFVIATAGDRQVAAAMWPDQPRALIVLMNGNNKPITFLPQEVVAEAIQTNSDGTQRFLLDTYSAEEYEKKARPAQGWDTTMSLLAARDYPAVSAMIQDKMRAGALGDSYEPTFRG